MGEQVGALIGLDAKLYYGPVGSSAATELTNVRDLTMPDSYSEANISDRSTAFHLTRVARRTIEVNFTMINRDDDVHLDAIRNAYGAKTILAFKVLDKASGKGVLADWQVVKFERNEPDETEQTYAVTVKPTRAPGGRVPVPV